MRIVALIIAAIAVWAASDSVYGAEPIISTSNQVAVNGMELPGCPPATNIITTFDPDPVFTWDSGCGGFLLLIALQGSTGAQWGIDMGRGQHGIISPVHYGVVPEGATEYQSPAVLTPGASYDVILQSSFGASLGTFVAPVKVPTDPAAWTMIKAAYR
jgi:hypothetical protein